MHQVGGVEGLIRAVRGSMSVYWPTKLILAKERIVGPTMTECRVFPLQESRRTKNGSNQHGAGR